VLLFVVFVLAHPRLPRAYFAKGENRPFKPPALSASAVCPLARFTLLACPGRLAPLALSFKGSLEGGPEGSFKGTLPHHFPCTPKSFRMNTCESVSKQRTLSAFRMNTCEKHRGVGVLWLTNYPMRVVVPSCEGSLFASKKDFYPEGASRPRDLSRYPTRIAVPSDHREPRISLVIPPADRSSNPESRTAKSDELTHMESHSYTKHRGRGVPNPELRASLFARAHPFPLGLLHPYPLTLFSHEPSTP
jgi:hypothetical protein